MILNRTTDGLLSVLLVLRRAVLAWGAMPRERLLELCAPEGAVRQDSPPSQMMVWKTLQRWLQLGLFQQEGEIISLAPEFARIALDDVEGMRTAVLNLVLRPENNRAIDHTSGDVPEERSGASDFTRTAGWALAQDPFALSTVPDVISFAREQKVEPDLFVNETRWPGFKEWAHFLGIALPLAGKSLILNPARAIRGVLEALRPNEPQLPIDEFLASLSAILPILDGGTYRTTVDRQIQRPWKTFGPYDISPCLSLGLLQLRHEGLVRLDNLADSRTRMTLLGRKGRALEPVTHLVREQR